MKKLTKPQFYLSLLSLTVILWLVIGFLSDIKFFGDVTNGSGIIYGWFHVVFNIVYILLLSCVSFYLIFDWLIFDAEAYDKYLQNFKFKTDDKEDKNYNIVKKFKLKSIILIAFGLFLMLYVFKGGRYIYKDMKTLYNTHIVYENNYNLQSQNRDLFYSKMWQTYIDKHDIASLNKDVFVEVTKLIMENRSDGKNLLWKWTQENQQIPFDNFTDFYSDLSNYITSQREQYYVIELNCQKISNMNNIMLDTFPNNIYNKLLKLESIKNNINN